MIKIAFSKKKKKCFCTLARDALKSLVALGMKEVCLCSVLLLCTNNRGGLLHQFVQSVCVPLRHTAPPPLTGRTSAASFCRH